MKYLLFLFLLPTFTFALTGEEMYKVTKVDRGDMIYDKELETLVLERAKERYLNEDTRINSHSKLETYHDKMVSLGYSCIGENMILKYDRNGKRDFDPYYLADIAQYQFRNSPTHWDNIMNPKLTYMGAAVYGNVLVVWYGSKNKCN